MLRLVEEAKRRAGVDLHEQEEHEKETDNPELLLPVTIHLPREGQRYSFLHKLSTSPWKVASQLSYALGFNEAEEKAAAEQISRAIVSYARHAIERRREETRVLLEIYVKVGDRAFRDHLDVDLGAFGGVTITLLGTVQQYVTSICADLNLDPKAWMTPITKKVYALLQEATEDLQRAPQDVKAMQPLNEAQAVRSAPSNLPSVEAVNPELDAYESERDRRREEKRLNAAKQRQSEQRSRRTSPS
ncbi:hypothetical protein DUNSADRAFT_12525 [Dunaliella salina]|uniref:Uncharacterized protein n=1 Tax=Dunaliella salina TaxID=3046 RepID=A0ABQ7GB68_DUNSA|nr:hypothetical protein DUNSADRAFT_12525 [Dunaliella salina]|eukprot:KAF5831838.1 hypothetical protein DUNSADRAFT_12525 [Dunaliella salina]